MKCTCGESFQPQIRDGCPVHGRAAPPAATDPLGTIEYPGYTEAQLCAVMAESYASALGDASGTFVAASDMRRMADALSVFLKPAGVAAQPAEPGTDVNEFRAEADELLALLGVPQPPQPEGKL